MGQSKKGQEEFVGFAIIMVIVMIIIAFFVVFTMQGNNSFQIDQSYQIDSFVQSALQFTTNCSSSYGNISVSNLVSKCESGDVCGEESSCKLLNSTLKDLLNASWNVKNGSIVKGYEFNVVINGQGLLDIKAGTKTSSYKTAPPEPVPNGDATLRVYY